MNKLKGVLNSESKVQVNIIGTGPQGRPGSSAYQIWLEQGNEGSEEDFLNSLKGSEVDYEMLENKPRINSVELIGDKEFEELGLDRIENEDISKLI